MSVLNEFELTISAEPVTAVEVPERELSSYYVQTVPTARPSLPKSRGHGERMSIPVSQVRVC